MSLTAIAPFLTKAVCLQINNILGVNNPSGNPPSGATDISAVAFSGTFDSYPWGLNVSSPFLGKAAACFASSSTTGISGAFPEYHFYQVLVTGNQS